MDDEWTKVWADYDRRQAVRTAPQQIQPKVVPPRPSYAPTPPPAVAAPRARSRRRRLLLGGLAAAAAIWLAAPGVAAWQVARAVSGQDHAAIGRHLDGAAIQAAMRDSFGTTIARFDDGPAARYLTAMADDMAAAWASPAALAVVAQARGARPGGPERLLRLRPTGLTSFELPLGDGSAPVRLRFGLAQGSWMPRWQVTGIRMDLGAPRAAAAPNRLGMR